MAEYIDRDYVLKLLGVFNDRVHGDYHFMNGIETAKEIVEDAPAADVQPVKHGRWVLDNSEQVLMHCSNCNWFNLSWKWKYCPYCGAKMDGA